METINIKDVELLYGCDMSNQIFDDVDNSQVKLYLYKKSIKEDGLYNAYVYASDDMKRFKCFDMFKQWRYTFNNKIDISKLIELTL